MDELKNKARTIIRTLRKEFPGATTALEYRTPFQLLVATILSAQCTDMRVNKVTPGLFQKYPGPREMAAAVPGELEQEIRSTGFFRMKTKNIMACSSSILERHGGNVPADFGALVALPGVGRKTANCVMGAAFGVNSGVVVDTHVQRISKLLGLTKEEDPVKIEKDLMATVPRKDWYDFSNVLILHGRKTCIARRPKCQECGILRECPFGLAQKGSSATEKTTRAIRKLHGAGESSPKRARKRLG